MPQFTLMRMWSIFDAFFSASQFILVSHWSKSFSCAPVYTQEGTEYFFLVTQFRLLRVYGVFFFWCPSLDSSRYGVYFFLGAPV